VASRGKQTATDMDLNDLDSTRKRSLHEALARHEEFLGRRKLALELINTGYRVLSRLSDARKLLRDMVGHHVR
jgi:hypothetical protein